DRLLPVVRSVALHGEVAAGDVHAAAFAAADSAARVAQGARGFAGGRRGGHERTGAESDGSVSGHAVVRERAARSGRGAAGAEGRIASPGAVASAPRGSRGAAGLAGLAGLAGRRGARGGSGVGRRVTRRYARRGLLLDRDPDGERRAMAQLALDRDVSA